MENDPTIPYGWAALKPGDTVYLIAPSTRVEEGTLQYTAELLAGMGLKVKYSEDISKPYHAWGNTAAHRAGQIIEALNDPQVKAIYSLEGGEGAAEVVAELKKREPELLAAPNRGKPIIGYSDTTIVEHYLGELGLASPVQGPVPAYLATNDREVHGFGPRTPEQIEAARHNLEAYRHFLMDEHATEPPMTLHALNAAARQARQIEGVLVGGSDQITALSRFTTHGPKIALHAAADKPILLLEGKSLQELHDTLVALRESGDLKRYQGIVLGAYYANQDDPKPKFPTHQVMEVLKRARVDESLPVYHGAEFGHPRRGAAMKPIPLYTHTLITAAGENAEMIVDRSATRAEMLGRPEKPLPEAAPGQTIANPMPISMNVISLDQSFVVNTTRLQAQDMAGKHVTLHFKLDPQRAASKDAAVNPVHLTLEPLVASGKLRNAASLTISTSGDFSPEFNAWLKDYAKSRLPGVPVRTEQRQESIRVDQGHHTQNTIAKPDLSVRVGSAGKASSALPGH